MEIYLQKLKTWFEEKDLKFRLFLLIIIFLGLGLFSNLLFFTHFSQSLKQVENKKLGIEKEIKLLDEQYQSLSNALKENLKNNGNHELLKSEFLRLNEHIGSFSSELITEEKMEQLLKKMLKTFEGLQFLNLTHQSKTDRSSDENHQLTTFYRHEITIVLKGEYEPFIQYLKALEVLPVRFFWDSVEYEVSHYPNSKITLHIHTLSHDDRFSRKTHV